MNGVKLKRSEETKGGETYVKARMIEISVSMMLSPDIALFFTLNCDRNSSSSSSSSGPYICSSTTGRSSPVGVFFTFFASSTEVIDAASFIIGT